MKKIIQALFLVSLAFISSATYANSLTVNNASITKIDVIETGENSTNARIHINGNIKIGTNPNSQNLCEVRVLSKTVYSAALAALTANKKVSITYVDNSNGGIYCKVSILSVE